MPRGSAIIFKTKVFNNKRPPRQDLDVTSVPHLPGFSRDFDCFDSILEWDGISGMGVVFNSLIFWPF